jgi:hypothetical protein
VRYIYSSISLTRFLGPDIFKVSRGGDTLATGLVDTGSALWLCRVSRMVEGYNDTITSASNFDGPTIAPIKITRDLSADCHYNIRIIDAMDGKNSGNNLL